jgi:hypothetical protein
VAQKKEHTIWSDPSVENSLPEKFTKVCFLVSLLMTSFLKLLESGTKSKTLFTVVDGFPSSCFPIVFPSHRRSKAIRYPKGQSCSRCFVFIQISIYLDCVAHRFLPLFNMSLEQQSRSALVARIEGLMLCPVTLDPMADPVITSDGQTYDRSAIETWFNSGKTTSPATGAVLDNLNLVTPIALRNAIHETFPEAREQFEAALQVSNECNLFLNTSKRTSICLWNFNLSLFLS